MNPEKNNSKADPLLQRALELFEEERPETSQNPEAKRYENMFLSSLLKGVFGESALQASSQLAAAYQSESLTIASSSRKAIKQQEEPTSAGSLKTPDPSTLHCTVNIEKTNNDIPITSKIEAKSSHITASIGNRSDEEFDELNSDDSIVSYINRTYQGAIPPSQDVEVLCIKQESLLDDDYTYSSNQRPTYSSSNNDGISLVKQEPLSDEDELDSEEGRITSTGSYQCNQNLASVSGADVPNAQAHQEYISTPSDANSSINTDVRRVLLNVVSFAPSGAISEPCLEFFEDPESPPPSPNVELYEDSPSHMYSANQNLHFNTNSLTNKDSHQAAENPTSSKSFININTYIDKQNKNSAEDNLDTISTNFHRNAECLNSETQAQPARSKTFAYPQVIPINEDEDTDSIDQVSDDSQYMHDNGDDDVFYDADDDDFIELTNHTGDNQRCIEQEAPLSEVPPLPEEVSLIETNIPVITEINIPTKRKRDDDEGHKDSAKIYKPATQFNQSGSSNNSSVFNPWDGELSVIEDSTAQSKSSSFSDDLPNISSWDDELPVVEDPTPESQAVNAKKDKGKATCSQIHAIYDVRSDKPISLPESDSIFGDSIESLRPEDTNVQGTPKSIEIDNDFSIAESTAQEEQTSPEVDQVAIPSAINSTQKLDDPLPAFHPDTQISLKNWKEEEAKLTWVNREGSPPFRLTRPTITPLLDLGSVLQFWWYDAYEEYNNGSIYLFGKVLDDSRNKHVSCCVQIQNIKRELYFLPRLYKLNDEEEPTEETVELKDVRQEIETILERKGIRQWAMTECQRQYAFGLPDVPSEATYLKLNYSFTDYEIPTTIRGKTFSHVFGCNTGPLEHFIIKNDVMGPCWLELKNVSDMELPKSWCYFNTKISKPEDCSIMKDNNSKQLTTSPPLTILSLNLQTKMNREKNANEIIAASIFYCKDTHIEEQDSVEHIKGARTTFVRFIPGTKYSSDIHIAVANEKVENNHIIIPEISESTLLHNLLAKIHKVDPDVIVGHNFSNVTLDILLHRMKKFEVSRWQRLGRLRINRWPNMQPGAGGSGTITYQQRLFMAGRLVCDTFTASKDLVSSKSYHLSELASSQLHIEREDIKAHKLHTYFNNGDGVIELAKHCSFDAFLSYALMVKLQILPLTKQLTNLSGNLWSRSINGARSERNEYLLLHSFYNKQFICPDKNGFKDKRDLQFVDEELELEMPAKTKLKGANGKAEASYSGGLVLEPKTGFYDKYVLLLDFNSLYPSIMQEYNVCFSTMGGHSDNNSIPDTPSSQEALGILPQLVKTFVQQRQHIKKLMKDPNLPKSNKAQYNIQQMALKLTANSMYGCLGSSISRFYNKSLAMFITSKGREVLQSTVDLAKLVNLDVIYGDTDSVMIHTNQTSIAEAKSIGENFKRMVNERYKLLEIDIDGFFRHTLLLRKKKYAALSVKEVPDDRRLEESMEVKGLDLVRRDWCELSRTVSTEVLKYILSDNSRQEVVDLINKYLTRVAKRVNGPEPALEQFIIQKQLTKSPELYDSSRANPHVIVAKDMRRAGLAVKAGDVIPYIVCKSVDFDTKVASGFNEPRMPGDVKDGKAKIDLEWYLSKQILPPVARLCAPLNGFDLNVLVKCLGLDGSKLSETSKIHEQTELQEADDPDLLLLLDERRFVTIEKFVFECSHCSNRKELEDLVQKTDGNAIVSGFMCQSCGRVQDTVSVFYQIMLQVRKFIQKYYDSPFQCSELFCGYQTLDTKIIDGARCLQPTCTGYLVREYPEKMLYNQLSYFSNLFDYPYADDSNIVCLSEKVKKEISKYLDRFAYRYLNISDIMGDIII